MGDVRPTDETNNYLYEPDDNPDEFDAVHTLAIVSRVMAMYRRALKRMNVDRSVKAVGHFYRGITLITLSLLDKA